MKKILTVIGARPQFIKASVVSHALAKMPDEIEEVLLHTGQHFDANMSNIFFDQLSIPKPRFQLDIHGGPHGQMTARMLESIERIILDEKPDRVLVYGDTNSTLAGALAAIKLHVPVAHIEAGLRSFNMQMPEEVNRILTDNVSDLLFCPTETAIKNLEREGFSSKQVTMLNVGDVMQDAALFFAQNASASIESKPKGNFALATLHRAENTDDVNRLRSIINALNHIHKNIAPVLLPVHPRTRAAIQRLGVELEISVIDPVGYLEMIDLLQSCSLVLTDSGGLQKEAFFFRKPCITMRDQTEWVELVEIKANTLAGADEEQIIKNARQSFGVTIQVAHSPYGEGFASEKIALCLAK